MGQLAEFFSQLLETSDWPPRWSCGYWSDFHGWLYIASDVMIWLAYFTIPAIIVWFVQRRPTVPFLPVFWLFGAFILLCGTTHAIDALIFWWPAYRVSAICRFATAVVSLATVFALIRDLPRALELRPPGQDDAELDATKQLLSERDARIDFLESELARLRGR